MSWEQVPVGIARARRELREVLAEGPARPVDHAGHMPYRSEGPGQFDQNLTYRTPDPVWFPSHDRTTIPFRAGAELVELLDTLAGLLGRAEGIDSITAPAADGATLRVRLGTGTTIDIDLTEVPKC